MAFRTTCGVSKKQGTRFGSSYKKHHIILGSIFGRPVHGNPQNRRWLFQVSMYIKPLCSSPVHQTHEGVHGGCSNIAGFLCSLWICDAVSHERIDDPLILEMLQGLRNAAVSKLQRDFPLVVRLDRLHSRTQLCLLLMRCNRKDKKHEKLLQSTAGGKTNTRIILKYVVGIWYYMAMYKAHGPLILATIEASTCRALALAYSPPAASLHEPQRARRHSQLLPLKVHSIKPWGP